MNQAPAPVAENRDLKLLVLLLALGIAVFHLAMSAIGRDISREQHLATAVEFARGHLDVMRPVIVGFNANGTPTPLEFPAWQVVTAALMKGFGLWYGWGNVVALAFMFSSMWALFELARRFFSERVAWWTLLFSLTQPLNIIIGGEAGGDSTAWAFAVWFVYLAYRMINGGGWVWWPAALLCGCLSATTKAPFFMVAGLTAFFWLLRERRHSRAAWLQLASVGAVSCLIFLAWNIHAQHLYAQAEFPMMDLSILKGGEVKSLYFGDMAFRLHLGHWISGGWHCLTWVFGNLAYVALLLPCLRLRQTAVVWCWLAAAVVVTLIHTPLILVHWHYFFIFSPAVALLCACGVGEIESGIWQRLPTGTIWRFVALFTATLFSLAASLQVAHFGEYFLDDFKNEAGLMIKQHTAPSDKLIVWGAFWSEPFLRAERQGLTINNLSFLEEHQHLARLKELGYTKLVLMNPSPYLVALTTVTGSHAKVAVDLPSQLPATAKDWPVVLNSPCVMILDIPK